LLEELAQQKKQYKNDFEDMLAKVQSEELEKRKAFDKEKHLFNLRKSEMETEINKL